MIKLFGIILIVCALVCNQWLIGWILSADGNIQTFLYKVLIWIVQGILTVTGSVLIFTKGEQRAAIFSGVRMHATLIAVSLVVWELTMGKWFDGKNGIRDMNIPYSVCWSYDVSQLYPHSGKTIYTRDKYGLRGSYPDPSRIRILTIGSSTTDNMMITDGETWQDVLQRDLFAAGDTFYVANAGLNGHTSENNIEAFEYWFPSIPRFKPDYIIFMIGWVDLLTAPAPAVDENHPWITVFKSKSALWDFKRSITGWFTIKIPKSPLNPEKITWTETPLLDSAAYDTLLRDKLVAFKEKLIRLIELSRNLGAEPVFVTQPSVIWRNRNGILSGSDVANPFTEKEHAGVKINGVDTYHMARRQDRLIKKIADKYHAAFFDVVPDSNWTTTDWWDGVHFTPQGCKKLGDLLFQRLNSLIASREPATCPLRSGMNDRMAERSRI